MPSALLTRGSVEASGDRRGQGLPAFFPHVLPHFTDESPWGSGGLTAILLGYS